MGCWKPSPHFGGQCFIFLVLTTDDGIGEIYVATFGPQVIAKMIEDVEVANPYNGDRLHIEMSQELL